MRRLALLGLLLGVAASTAAAPVVILRSKDLGPYNEAITGFGTVCTQPAKALDVAGADAAALAAEVRAEKPRVLLLVGTRAAQLARRELADLPAVFCMVEDPEGNDALGPLMTGVRMQIPYRRQFEMMRTAYPALDLVGVIYDPGKTRDDVPAAVAAAKELGISLVEAKVSAAHEIDAAIASLAARKIDLLWLTTDPTMLDHESLGRVVVATEAAGLPLVAPGTRSVQAGTFLSIAPSYPRIGEQAGRLANRILAGTKVADIPIETPEAQLLGR